MFSYCSYVLNLKKIYPHIKLFFKSIIGLPPCGGSTCGDPILDWDFYFGIKNYITEKLKKNWVTKGKHGHFQHFEILWPKKLFIVQHI